MTSILQVYRALPIPGGDVFAVAEHPEHRDVLIGKDATGAPAVVVQHSTREDGVPVVLRNAMLIPCARVVITRGQATEEIDAAVYRCRAPSQVLREYFVVSVAGIVASALRAGTFDAATVLRQLAELFHRLALPATRSLQGFWGELFLISESTTPTSMLDAWHADSYEQFDFARGAERLEMKTCGSLPRTHHFSLGQIRPAGDVIVFVASLVCRRSTAGADVHALLDKVRQLAISPNQRAKVELLAADVLSDDSDVSDVRFDLQEARASLRFFCGADIASVPRDLPEGVSNVHFDALLSESAPLAAAPSGSWLLAAAWPAERR